MAHDKTEIVFEYFAPAPGERLRVDAEKGIIYDVKILGPTSENNRDYSPEVQKAAHHHYEGVRVNVDHPDAKTPTAPRSYADRIGSLHGIYLKGDSTYAREFRFNPQHRLGPQLIWDAQNAPHVAGFSHNAAIKTRPGAKGRIVVESISKVLSVDLVADPATTRGFFEQVDSTKPEAEQVEITLEGLRQSHPEIVRSIATEAVESHRVTEGVVAKDATIKTLEAKIETLTAEKTALARRSQVEQLIAEAKLPEGAASPLFVSLCMEAKDEAALEALIEDRKGFAAAPAAKTPAKVVSKDQHATESRSATAAQGEAPKDAKDFASSLKRSS